MAIRAVLFDVGGPLDTEVEHARSLGDELGMLEHDLGHERPRLEVAAPLELEEVTLGADHRASPEPFE